MITIKIRRSRTSWPRRRPQRWFWVALSGNGKTLARSEMYTNRSDCAHNATLLFGNNPDVTIG